jgi:MFS family permease
VLQPYVDLFRRERRILSFGMLMTFFSSFGQTFFISLFVPAWEKEFALGSGMYGTLYSLATLGSACVMPFVGKWIDHLDLRTFSLGAALLMGIASIGMGFAHTAVHLLVLLFLLRLSGQGLCGLIANTTMARRFHEGRGKALSISTLGFPLGEAIFPAFIVTLLGVISWRHASILNAGMILIILVPCVYILLAPESLRTPSSGNSAIPTIDSGEKEWTRSHVLRDWRFYALLPNFLMIPFAVTGLIFHQIKLAEFKGWTIDTFAFAFIGFAAVRIVCSLGIGHSIDRFGAKRLFPYVSFPLVVGIGFLMIFDQAWAAWVYLTLMGASMGVISAVGTALWAELYGVKHLGAIKSLGTSLGIFGTALSPFLFGWILEAKYNFQWILAGTILTACVAGVLSMSVCLQRQAQVPGT